MIQEYIQEVLELPNVMINSSYISAIKNFDYIDSQHNKHLLVVGEISVPKPVNKTFFVYINNDGLWYSDVNGIKLLPFHCDWHKKCWIPITYHRIDCNEWPDLQDLKHSIESVTGLAKTTGIYTEIEQLE